MQTFRSTDGVTIAYSDTGTESGDTATPLVMVPGWGQTQDLFPPIPGRRVITLDHRGHGRSEHAEHGYLIARLGQDVVELLDHLGLDRVDLLGHSMGASVAWSLISLHGCARLRRLITVDQPAAVAPRPGMSQTEAQQCGAIGDFNQLWSLGEGLAGPDRADITRGFVAGMFADASGPVWDRVVEAIATIAPQVTSQLYWDHITKDWRPILPQITVPTLVLGCADSHVSAASQDYLAAQIPHARLEILPSDHHFPFVGEPEGFAKTVTSFLDEA